MRVSRSLIELKEVTTNPAVGYYLAYKYSFNAELTNSELFSRGFTVPEADSEEEDISAQSTRGSQLDPLFIEDSDAESESWEPKDNGDVTMAQLDEEAGQHEAAIDDESDEDEEETSLASIADSDIESEAVSTGSAHSHGSDSPLFHGAQFIEDVEDVEKITATEQVEARPADQCQLTATLSAPTHPTPAEQASAAMPFYGEFGYSNVPDMPFSPNPVSQNVESTPFDMTFAPPLPPRPSQKLQRMWDEVLQEDYQEKWLAEGSHDAPVFPSANFSTHAPLYRDTSFRASQQIELPHISSFSPELVSTFKPAADRIQTPPPTLTADVVSSTPPPPTRRTGVSITEIVDEQPPTPTSVNSRKRSADDAFNEDAEHNDEKTAAAGATRAESTPATETAAPASEEGLTHSVEQIAPLSHRPIAQPRSILRKALRAASLMVPATAFGAAVSIAALAALPESFFTVA